MRSVFARLHFVTHLGASALALIVIVRSSFQFGSYFRAAATLDIDRCIFLDLVKSRDLDRVEPHQLLNFPRF
jgi:hypothetical protein